MQVNKGLREKEKLRKELQQIKINLVKKGVPFYRFCAENNILRQSAEKAFNGQWKGEKAQEVRKKLIEASKVKYELSSNDMGS